MHAKDLTTDILTRLTGDALLMFYSCAEHFHAEACQGSAMAVSGEPVADLNYLMFTEATPTARAAFERYVADLDGRDLPFVCMLGPDALEGLKPDCERAGLVYAVDWPLMLCPAASVEAHSKEGIEVRRAASGQDVADASQVLSAAFQMPLDSLHRVLTAETVKLPGIEIHVARAGDEAVSTVTVTCHGRLAGIWSMGTPPDRQGQGLGKVLLSQVMAEQQRRGVETFFLGATPAGQPLYEKLGYRTVDTAQVWVRGETHQA
jgi:ribosomal protein S18 acetylase RimI-like enzyme